MMIKDLTMSNELDRRARSEIRGGYQPSAEQFCGTPPSSPEPAIGLPIFALPYMPYVPVPGSDAEMVPYPDL